MELPCVNAGILEGLNPPQCEAVIHDEGPLLIIAGAGTGKTTVVTRRIAYLIAEKRARPEEILALTFTDKAAAEMEERVDQLVPYGYADVPISTFHAFGDRVLRENALEVGLTPELRILTRAEQVIFFRDHLFGFPLKYYRPLSDPTKFVDAILGLFSRCKDEDITPEEYLKFATELQARAEAEPEDTELRDRATQQMELALTYRRYQELMAAAGNVDFGDQIIYALRLFRLRPYILSAYQKRFRYILVDEFQDTNYAQFELVKLLAAKHQNIAVVADDDQSIYKFRGAAISNVLGFKEHYPGARGVVLTENHRSPQAILDAAYRLIRFNDPDRLEVKHGIDKRLLSAKGEGTAPWHIHFDTATSEADGVAQLIAEGVEAGRRYGDFAILVRSNNDADPFLRSLNMRGIPWTFSGNQGLYARPEIRLLIAFLRCLARIDDSVSLHYLASSTLYRMPMVDLTRCATYADRKNRPLFDVFRAIEETPELVEHLSVEGKAAIAKLQEDLLRYMERAREIPTGELLYEMLSECGWIARMAKTGSVEEEAEVQNIRKFFDKIRAVGQVLRHDRVPQFVSYLDSLIDAGDDPAVAEAEMDTDAVHVMTVHKAKGLEFPVVFLVGLVSNRFPWPRRRDPIELPTELIKDVLPTGDFHLQEERRLFYVGMTRAREALYLTSARDYGGSRERKVSQFLLEALDLPKTPAAPRKASALEAIQQNAPPPERDQEGLGPIPDDEPLTISHQQVDDYQTCPLKYKYVHILRVPIIRHHSVAYGSALHKAVEHYLRRRAAGLFTPEEDLLKAFDEAWQNEGFVTWEHEEQRKEAGRQALRRFYHEEEALGTKPTYVEKEFAFTLGKDRVRGRFDRVDLVEDGGAVIIDYKSSDLRTQKDADKRAKESLQLSIYTLAHEQMHGRLPDRVELHFLETGLVGRATRTRQNLEEAVLRIQEAARGIRSRDYTATPDYMACRYCAYNQICPHTATRA